MSSAGRGEGGGVGGGGRACVGLLEGRWRTSNRRGSPCPGRAPRSSRIRLTGSTSDRSGCSKGSATSRALSPVLAPVPVAHQTGGECPILERYRGPVENPRSPACAPTSAFGRVARALRRRSVGGFGRAIRRRSVGRRSIRASENVQVSNITPTRSSPFFDPLPCHPAIVRPSPSTGGSGATKT